MTLTVGSLFSGIGGLDLGLERAGMTVRWQSEIHPYGSRVLAKHWPDVQEGVLQLLAQQGEDVQPYLSLGAWSTQCTQALGSRVDRLVGLGNAVVPQVAEYIGRRILETM